MMNASDVIPAASHGIIKELAAEYDVSLARIYEILGKDNPYPKAKRLIRAIAHHNQSGARLIKADLDAMFRDILTSEMRTPTAVDLHKEAFEAVQSVLQGKSPAEQKQELRELIAVAEMMLEGVDRRMRA